MDGFEVGGADSRCPFFQNFLFIGQKGFHSGCHAGQIHGPFLVKKKIFLDILPLQLLDAVCERPDGFPAIQIIRRIGLPVEDFFQAVLFCFFP